MNSLFKNPTGVTRVKKMIPITIGGITFPRISPSLNHKNEKGLNKFGNRITMKRIGMESPIY